MPQLIGVRVPHLLLFTDLDHLISVRNRLTDLIDEQTGPQDENLNGQASSGGRRVTGSPAAATPNACAGERNELFKHRVFTCGQGEQSAEINFQPRFNLLTILDTIQKYGPLIQQFAQMLGEIAQAAQPPAKTTTFAGTPGGIPHP